MTTAVHQLAAKASTILSRVSFLPLLISATSTNHHNPNQTKAKRTVADQTFSNENGKAIVFYMENPYTPDIPELQASASSPGLRNFYSTPSKPLALVTVQHPVQVFEQDGPKQVAAQQVLYEFQQTPTNSESNVHVKQLFQPNVEFTTQMPLYQNQQIEQLPTTQSLSSIHPSTPIISANQHFLSSQQQTVDLVNAPRYHPETSETVLSPVQHNIYTNHGLNSASFSSYNPLLPSSQQYQNTHISPKQSPGKYIYLNGKIVYHPGHPGHGQGFPQNSIIYKKGGYHNHQKVPFLNYDARHNRPDPQNGVVYGNPLGRPMNKFQQSGNIPPITNPRFQPPIQLQPVDKSLYTIQQQDTEEEDERADINKGERNKEDDEGDEKESYEEEDEVEEAGDESYPYDSSSFEESDYLDKEDDHHYRPLKSRKHKEKSRPHDKERVDADKGDRKDARSRASKQNVKYDPSNSSRNYRIPPKYDSSENYEYSSNMKYKTPTSQNNSKTEKPQGQFKKVKYRREPRGKPKIKTIEGRFSEQVPVTQKHKMYKERWFMSKDIEGQKKHSKHI